MKDYILFALITIIAMALSEIVRADVQFNINYNDTKFASQQITKSTSIKALKQLKKMVNKSKHLTGEFNNIEVGSLYSLQNIFTQELEYFHPISFTFVEDTEYTARLAKQAIMAKIKANISCGKSVIELLVYNNATKQLTTDQVRTLVDTYSSIRGLLDTGSLNTALLDIQNIVVDGTIVTEQDKIDLTGKINECKQ